jgi:transcriptional regulator of arginine metabolism
MYNYPSACITMKTRRQSLILQLLDREPIRNQEQLRRGLRAQGVVATQATISRDIKELGLVKRAADGAYQRSTAPVPASSGTTALTRALADSVVDADRVQQFVVLKTPPGQANVTAIAIDRARLVEVVGTIAGDDTILVIVRDPRRAAAFEARVRDIIGR